MPIFNIFILFSRFILNFQTIIRTQMIQRHRQPGQADQQPDYSTHIMATGVGTPVSTGGGRPAATATSL